ncbi:hypothetical protein C8F01DRAFT_1147036, partial [Mycena amicta]
MSPPHSAARWIRRLPLAVSKLPQASAADSDIDLHYHCRPLPSPLATLIHISCGFFFHHDDPDSITGPTRKPKPIEEETFHDATLSSEKDSLGSGRRHEADTRRYACRHGFSPTSGLRALCAVNAEIQTEPDTRRICLWRGSSKLYDISLPAARSWDFPPFLVFRTRPWTPLLATRPYPCSSLATSSLRPLARTPSRIPIHRLRHRAATDTDTDSPRRVHAPWPCSQSSSNARRNWCIGGRRVPKMPIPENARRRQSTGSPSYGSRRGCHSPARHGHEVRRRAAISHCQGRSSRIFHSCRNTNALPIPIPIPTPTRVRTFSTRLPSVVARLQPM